MKVQLLRVVDGGLESVEVVELEAKPSVGDTIRTSDVVLEAPNVWYLVTSVVLLHDGEVREWKRLKVHVLAVVEPSDPADVQALTRLYSTLV